jgi:hypothetical protein
MRLAGIEKGGFLSLPNSHGESCKRNGASWFIPFPAGTRGRLFDPCAGEGEIASLLGKLLNCKTWGCELFPYRAENAATRMERCHSAARLVFIRRAISVLLKFCSFISSLIC